MSPAPVGSKEDGKGANCVAIRPEPPGPGEHAILNVKPPEFGAFQIINLVSLCQNLYI